MSPQTANFSNGRLCPLGLANAPAMFQELMNQVLPRMKRKGTVQHLLKRGAVIEAYIEDVLLRTYTVEDHLKPVEEFLRNCDQLHTKVKLSKCEFMKGMWAWKSVGAGGDP